VFKQCLACGLLLLCVAGLLTLGTQAVDASQSGPVPSVTGGFGEMTCQQCHWDNPINAAPGRLTLSGLPSEYTPGDVYPITITLTKPDATSAGFQLGAREDVMAMNAGASAGSLQPSDGLTQTIQDEKQRVTYIQQTRSGSMMKASGEARWTFTWTAPEMGAVVMHVAANAGNGDTSPLGDFIYTATAHTRAR
jgi:hypothetical protein